MWFSSSKSTQHQNQNKCGIELNCTCDGQNLAAKQHPGQHSCSKGLPPKGITWRSFAAFCLPILRCGRSLEPQESHRQSIHSIWHSVASFLSAWRARSSFNLESAACVLESWSKMQVRFSWLFQAHSTDNPAMICKLSPSLKSSSYKSARTGRCKRGCLDALTRSARAMGSPLYAGKRRKRMVGLKVL